MGTKPKEKMKLARTEAVERLRALANDLERGSIMLGDQAFSVPDEVRLEVKAEQDELEVELKWKAAAIRAPAHL